MKTKPIIQIDEKNIPLFVQSFDSEKAGSSFLGLITYNKKKKTIKGNTRIRNNKTFDSRITEFGGKTKYTKRDYEFMKNGLQATTKVVMKNFKGTNYLELEFKREHTLKQVLDTMQTMGVFNIQKDVREVRVDKTVDKIMRGE